MKKRGVGTKASRLLSECPSHRRSLCANTDKPSSTF